MAGQIHPFDAVVPAAAAAAAGQQQPDGGINGLPVLAGTWRSVLLRGVQGLATAAALAVLVSAGELGTLRPLRFLAGVTLVQLCWIATVCLMDLYVVAVMRSLHNTRVLLFLVLGDVLTGLLLFTAACMSAGVVVYVSVDLDICAGHPCARFLIGIAVSFLTCVVLAPSFFLSLWALVSLWVARILHPLH